MRYGAPMRDLSIQWTNEDAENCLRAIRLSPAGKLFLLVAVPQLTPPVLCVMSRQAGSQTRLPQGSLSTPVHRSRTQSRGEKLSVLVGEGPQLIDEIARAGGLQFGQPRAHPPAHYRRPWWKLRRLRDRAQFGGVRLPGSAGLRGSGTPWLCAGSKPVLGLLWRAMAHTGR